MDFGGVTWIVVADGAHARIFEERRRAGPLTELTDEALKAESGDHPHGHHHESTVHERFGPGRHGAGERPLVDETLHRFMRRLVEQLRLAVQRRACDMLVLIAPPRALGALKAELSPGLAGLVAGTDSHDCVREDADEIRRRLRDLRLAAH